MRALSRMSLSRKSAVAWNFFTNYRKFTDEVARLNDKVWKQQNEIQDLESDLRDGMVEKDFEWQQDLNARIMSLRSQTEVDLQDLGFSERRLVSYRDEIARKYPELSSNIEGFEDGLKAKVDEDAEKGVTEVKAVEGSEMFASGSRPVYAWLLGRLTFDGKICCMLFGQFSKDIEPPTDGWIYVGKNVDRNLLSTDAVASKFLDDGSDTC